MIRGNPARLIHFGVASTRSARGASLHPQRIPAARPEIVPRKYSEGRASFAN